MTPTPVRVSRALRMTVRAWLVFAVSHLSAVLVAGAASRPVPCPARPLRAGLCLNALPAHPQEVRVQAGLMLPFPFLELGAVLPVHLSLAKKDHLWRAGGSLRAGGGLSFVPTPLFFRLLVHSEGLS